MAGEAPKVIVVEDDASMSQALERILRAGGFVPMLFSSAEAAFEAGVVAAAECLVFDVRLPGMSGFELFRRLASTGVGRPTIFITAQDEPAVREEAESLGAKSYLPKPFSGRTLLDAVTRAIGSRTDQH